MGRLIKNHWARLVVLIAATIQIGGAIQGFFWPKVTWDFATLVLNCLVSPFPALQVINLMLGSIVLAWEWPLGIIAGRMYHRSIHARLVMFPICAVSTVCLYQSHMSAIYYMLGICGYILALSERETIYPEPWNSTPIDIPKRIVDCEREPQDNPPQDFEREPEADEEKSSTCGSSLTQVPTNQSSASKPSTRFQLPAAHEERSLSDVNRKNDPSKVYRRMRSKTWHPEMADEDGIDHK